MALARVTTWNPGDVLTAAALNGEFNNTLNNPVALISPTTGPINFNLQAHTGLRLENLTVDPASTSIGRIFFNTARNQAEVDDGTIIRAMPSLSATAISSGDLILGSSSNQFTRLGIGSTGQVLTVTSSNTQPSWGVIGPAGLTTGAITAGATLFYTTAAAPLLTTLAIGTSGQVLTVSTSLTPGWAASAGGGASPSLDPEVAVVFYDDFIGTVTSSNPGSVTGANTWTLGSSNTAMSTVSGPRGVIIINSDAAVTGSLTLGSAVTPLTLPFTSTSKPTLKVRWSQGSTGAFASQMMVGLTDTAPASIPVNGIYFASSAPNATVYGIVRNTNVQSTISMGVTATAYHNYQAIVTASSTVNFLLDAVSVGTINSSNVPNTGLCPGAGVNATTTASTLLLDSFYVTTTR